MEMQENWAAKFAIGTRLQPRDSGMADPMDLFDHPILWSNPHFLLTHF
jgi:hypothetical protein